MSTEIHRCAGVTYYKRPALGLIRMLPEQAVEVRLTPEPTNSHDPNAVRIEIYLVNDPKQEWIHVGYIPRTESAHVAELIAAGRVQGVGIARLGTLRRDDNIPWLRIAIQTSEEGASA